MMLSFLQHVDSAVAVNDNDFVSWLIVLLKIVVIILVEVEVFAFVPISLSECVCACVCVCMLNKCKKKHLLNSLT